MSQPVSKFNDNLTKVLSDRLFYNKQANVNYKARTLNATPVEVFIDGLSGYRLKPPANSIMWVDYRAIGSLEATAGDNGHHASRGSFMVRQSPDGTLALKGTDVGMAASSGNPWVFSPFGTAGHCAFTVDNTNDYMVLTLTGAANPVTWEIWCNVMCVAVPAMGVDRSGF